MGSFWSHWHKVAPLSYLLLFSVAVVTTLSVISMHDEWRVLKSIHNSFKRNLKARLISPGPAGRWRLFVETLSSSEFATCPSICSSSGPSTACCTTNSSSRGSASTTPPPTMTSGTAGVQLGVSSHLSPLKVFFCALIYPYLPALFQHPWLISLRWCCSSKGPWWKWRTSRSFWSWRKIWLALITSPSLEGLDPLSWFKR